MTAVIKMMRLARAFRTSNSQICNICKNDYLPGQIFLDRENNILRCVECEWEATYMTKIYPGEKPAYTPHPPKHDDEQLMERPPKRRDHPPKRRDHPVEKLQ